MKIKSIFSRDFHELSGCVHSHSEYSYDGTTPIKKIIKAAERNYLDYITINDHRNDQAKNDPDLNSSSQVKVIVGAEINDPSHNHHYLVFNQDKILVDEDVETYVDYYKKNGAFGIAAHPKERRKSKHFRKYCWKTDKTLDIDAVEIWNFASNWVGKLIPALNGLAMILFQKSFVRNPYKPNLEFWESYLDSGRKVAAVGSVDAHAQCLKLGWFKYHILTHKNLFKTIKTNVLIPKSNQPSKNNILKALKNGNSYIFNAKLGTVHSFYAGIAKKHYGEAIFGESIQFQEGLKFFYKIPNLTTVKLIRNGKIIKKNYDANGAFEIKKPGRYRLHISRKFSTWIITNYIFVEPKEN